MLSDNTVALSVLIEEASYPSQGRCKTAFNGDWCDMVWMDENELIKSSEEKPKLLRSCYHSKLNFHDQYEIAYKTKIFIKGKVYSQINSKIIFQFSIPVRWSCDIQIPTLTKTILLLNCHECLDFPWKALTKQHNRQWRKINIVASIKMFRV